MLAQSVLFQSLADAVIVGIAALSFSETLCDAT